MVLSLVTRVRIPLRVPFQLGYGVKAIALDFESKDLGSIPSIPANFMIECFYTYSEEVFYVKKD